MHLSHPLGTSRREERGAVAILVAVSLTMLLIVTAMVLDFGLVRLDRQRVKLVADNAVMSGLRAADKRTGQVYSFAGVCGALAFLKANEPSLSGLPAGICATPDDSVVCNPADPSANAAVYTGTVSNGGVSTDVTIKLPYQLSDGDFAEESYASVAGDTTTANGCDQLGVIIRQSRSPGLGSLATSADLILRQRSVGRVVAGPGELPPALLLLERTACSVLTVGSGGSPSRIKVFASTVPPVPASIHADTDASGADCGSGPNQQVFQGKQTDGVVAYGTGAGEPGIITSVARENGVSADVITDGSGQVYATSAVNESGAGNVSAVQPRALVTRRLVDERYLAGVTAKVQAAFAQWSLNHSAPSGYDRYGCPTAGDMSALASTTVSDSVYIDCPGSSGITLEGVIGAGKIYFHGFIKSGKLRMPNATQVFVDNTDNSGARISAQAINLSANGSKFCIGALTCDSLSDVDRCTPSTTTDHADLIIRRGSLETSGGTFLRLCNSTVILEGGQLGAGDDDSPGGCLPTSNGTEPTITPCPGASDPAGNGLVSVGGTSDWTAPNAHGDMNGMTFPERQLAWDGGEDLALWTETYGDGPDFKMAGGGQMNVAGVFMVPNATPFTVTGTGNQDLTDAQFITRKFAVDGGAILTMKVDPYNAITLPDLGPFILIR